MQKWMNLGVSGQVGWPTARYEVEFDGHKLVLLPPSKTTYASIHVEVTHLDRVEALTLVNRFLSILSWCDGQSLENHYGWSGNPTPTPVPLQRRVLVHVDFFAFARQPLKDPRQKLAVALYREARSVNSIPYEFLGYFKVLNILHTDGLSQKVWIRETLPKLIGERARDRIAAITSSHPDVAEYLYHLGRCAIAHAYSDPVVDPDDVSHLRRLSEDLNLVRELAEYAIEHELSVCRCLWSDAP